jgi:hypothetical protein
MKWRPAIRVRAFAGCPLDVARAVKRAARLVKRVSPVRHYLTVGIAPHWAIEGPGGLLCAGVFAEPKRGYHPRILLAAGAAAWWQGEWGWTRRRSVREMAYRFLHEYAHYEQFRDRRPIQERGVNVRTESLMKLIEGTK